MIGRACAHLARIAQWIHNRGALFWAITLPLGSITALFAASQVAHDRGQSVGWYTGFGQWLGALGSFTAAGVALWIALDGQRRDKRQRESDLRRQAGLVRVSVERVDQRQSGGGFSKCAAIAIKSYRSGRIFHINVTQFLHRGKPAPPVSQISDGCEIFPITTQWNPSTEWSINQLALKSDDMLVLYLRGELSNPVHFENKSKPDFFVAVRYTDEAGHRWEVDSGGGVRRL